MNTNIERIQEEMSHRRFEALAHQFFKKWQPEDHFEAQQFSAELFSLVRQIYIDAVKPEQELMSKLMQTMIHQSPFLQK